jgi:two-component system LytT family sensor kinase
MTLERSTKIEWYSFLASMPLIDLGLNYILYKENLFHDYRVWLVSFPLIWAAGIITWYFHVLYSHAIQRKYPALSQSKKRVGVKCLVNIFIMTPAILIIFFLYGRLHILGYSLSATDLWNGILVGFAVNLVFSTLWEAMYIMDKTRESIAEKELLSQMSLQQEFDVLKSQVNPHFLFNCFNTLSSLINEDAKKAEVFLDELSKVYRYLLRNNETGLSTLQNELKFIESYSRLLKTRHGEAVQIQVESNSRYDNYLLPSLSLQMLVENAVKHNVLSKNKPLIIDIFLMAGNKLMVNNNLQLRTKKGPSNRIGLDNIRTKYKLLGQNGFHVMQDAKNFTVVLPLIWNSHIDKRLMAAGAGNTSNNLTTK